MRINWLHLTRGKQWKHNQWYLESELHPSLRHVCQHSVRLRTLNGVCGVVWRELRIRFGEVGMLFVFFNVCLEDFRAGLWRILSREKYGFLFFILLFVFCLTWKVCYYISTIPLTLDSKSPFSMYLYFINTYMVFQISDWNGLFYMVLKVSEACKSVKSWSLIFTVIRNPIYHTLKDFSSWWSIDVAFNEVNIFFYCITYLQNEYVFTVY